jgi:hypothetical protein
MKLELLKKKIEAERDVVPSMGIYRLYSFIMSLINDPRIARAFLINEYGYNKTDATRVASRYNYHNRNKA